jgi:hypothetical protein
MEFEPTRSYAYKFARYEILPELQKLPGAQSGETFRLLELAWPLIDARLSLQQQAIEIKKAKSDATDSMGKIVRFFVRTLIDELGIFVSDGNGYYHAAIVTDTSDTNIDDEVIEEGGDEADAYGGMIYAFSFPTIIKDGAFPIKVGKTTGDVQARVNDQCKGSATFEQPVVLGSWQVKRVGPTELAIHNTLKARGKHRENAPGKEWFDTTIPEVKAILDFVVG